MTENTRAFLARVAAEARRDVAHERRFGVYVREEDAEEAYYEWNDLLVHQAQVLGAATEAHEAYVTAWKRALEPHARPGPARATNRAHTTQTMKTAK